MMRAATPVAVPARLVHPVRLYGASGLRLGAGARGCVLCWGVAGWALPVVVCFLFWACVPLLTVYSLCSSYLCSSFLSATPDAYSA